MKARITIIISLILLPLSFCLAHVPGNVVSQSKVFANVLSQASPTVVSITVLKRAPLTLPSVQSHSPQHKKSLEYSLGSGVIIDARHGLIVTNAHVVNHAKTIVIKLQNHRRYIAKTIGIDTGFDIAILKINAKHLTQLPFADSDKLKVGNFVAAIGSPFGLNQTVTSGVISALNVSRPKIEGYQSFIQTDASINPGNSGGALINMQGKLVGINTALFGPGANIGIGFAIPSNMVKSVVSQLLKYGKVEPGILGVIAQNITPELAHALSIKQTSGTIVSQVIPGSAADKAGIKTQDVITKVNKHNIFSSDQLRNTLGLMHPGTSIHITIKRRHRTQTLTAIVGNPNKLLMQKVIPFLAGIKLENFKELEGDGHYLTGALVTGIRPTSQAALAGLLPGDVITAANNHKIHSTSALVTIAKKPSEQLLLKVSRGNLSAFLVIEKPNS